MNKPMQCASINQEAVRLTLLFKSLSEIFFCKENTGKTWPQINRHTGTHTQKGRMMERYNYREKERERDKQTDRMIDRQTHRQTETDRKDIEGQRLL